MDNELIQQQQSPRLWTMDFVLITAASFFLFFGFQILLPTLPVYMLDLGGNNTAVGLIISIFTVFSLFTRPLVGALMNRSKKGWLIAGLILCFLIISSYNWTVSVAMLLLARCIHGVGWGIVTVTSSTIASDIIPANRRGEGIGFFGLASTLAMALAPAIGLALLDGKWQMHGVIVVAAVSTVLSLLCVWGVKKQRKQSDASSGSGDQVQAKTSFRSQLFEPKALFPSLLGLLIGIVYGGIVSFITLFGEEAQIGNVGLFFTLNAICLLIVRFISGRLFDRKGHTWVILPGSVLLAASLLVLSYAHSMTMLAISAVLFGFGFGAVQPSLQAWILNRVEPELRGPANATFYSAFDLGIGGGALLLGRLAEASSYAMMYRYSFLVIILFCIIYIAYSWKKS
ncbi:MFS transporter [Paenibacillus sp. ACRRY]|uniref:MFS transporter n=1 Tax=Paenibacillus sp. ACRRY TaxID=2918208 RepID=UPI001EF4508B|nr:MFS transporter [Paenibacillus sp. ACRRY]MCG7381554.1 MFS transporter [Paenibacillus sp. ACRRY]